MTLSPAGCRFPPSTQPDHPELTSLAPIRRAVHALIGEAALAGTLDSNLVDQALRLFENQIVQILGTRQMKRSDSMSSDATRPAPEAPATSKLKRKSFETEASASMPAPKRHPAHGPTHRQKFANTNWQSNEREGRLFRSVLGQEQFSQNSGGGRHHRSDGRKPAGNSTAGHHKSPYGRTMTVQPRLNGWRKNGTFAGRLLATPMPCSRRTLLD